MKILELQTFGILGVLDGRYSFAAGPDQPHDRVVITGPPGSGKTRLLELIVGCREVLAPSDERIDHDSFIRRGNHTAKTIVTFWLQDDERRTIGAERPVVETEVIFGSDDGIPDPGIVFLLEAYGHDDKTPKLEYFSERRYLDVGGGEMSLEESRQVRFRSSDSPRKFAFVPSFLSRLPLKPAQAVRFATSLERLSRACRYDLEGHVLTSRNRPIRSLAELSASEADAVSFAATASLVGLSRSVVLVDTPELHGLDPARVVDGLTSLGSDNQIFLATSSPEIVAGFGGVVLRLGASAARF